MLKRALIEKTQREIDVQKSEGLSRIQIKTTALQNPSLIRALYQGSQAEVRVDLIVRDSYCLRPGIPGLSENISGISIVSRFLEHTRIYYFSNAGSEEYYIRSADCMSRNLESRVEILAPVEATELRTELRFILDTQLKDERSAWDMQPDGSYRQRVPTDGKESKSAQQLFIDRPERGLKEATRLQPGLEGQRCAE